MTELGRSRFRSGLVTAVRRVTPAAGPRPPVKWRVVSTKEQVVRSKSSGVSRQEYVLRSKEQGVSSKTYVRGRSKSSGKVVTVK